VAEELISRDEIVALPLNVSDMATSSEAIEGYLGGGTSCG
jgi:hypothetical protein